MPILQPQSFQHFIDNKIPKSMILSLYRIKAIYRASLLQMKKDEIVYNFRFRCIPKGQIWLIDVVESFRKLDSKWKLIVCRCLLFIHSLIWLY